jgi:hypothetical protein
MPSQPPPWRVQRYLSQKQGSAPGECEDAIACNPRTWACAVADGATEAFGSRHWARLLVRAWVRHPAAGGKDAFLELVTQLAGRAERHWAGRPLPWYAQEKRLQGSYAAFAGLVFRDTGEGLRWQAIALGDCCLFHFRGGALIAAVPLSEPEQFGFRPTLLPSRVDALLRCGEVIGSFEGAAAPGDEFLLLSDAAACWLLAAGRSRDAAADSFRRLLAQGRVAEITALVEAQRRNGSMRNDDVAALSIILDPPP